MIISTENALIYAAIALGTGIFPYFIFLMFHVSHLECGYPDTKRSHYIHTALIILFVVMSSISMSLIIPYDITMQKAPDIFVEKYPVSSIEDNTIYLENGNSYDTKDVTLRLSEDSASEYFITVRTETKQGKFLFITEIAQKRECILYVPQSQ